MDIQQVQQANENYLRADQEWRDAMTDAVLAHRGEGSELVIQALASHDTLALRKERLERLIEWENASFAWTALIRRPEVLQGITT